MIRPLRIEFEGACYHIISRGNNRGMIFRTKEDYHDFLELLEQLSDRFLITIYAYVLMGNHYHLLLKTRQENLSRAMQWLGTSYTRRFNIRNKQSGHLFQGRFKSILVENESYFLNLSCYIHGNPLRAKMVKRLVDYTWSSYPYYAYAEKKQPDWLYTKSILSLFGKGRDTHLGYREKVQNYFDENESVWENVKFGFIYGSQSFIDQIKDKYISDGPDKELPQLNQLLRDQDPGILIDKATKLLGCDLNDFKHARRLTGKDLAKRDVITMFLWETGIYTNKKIGECIGLTYSSVSRRLNQARRKLKSKNQNEIKAYYDLLRAIIKV